MPVIQKFDSPDVDPEDEIINLDNTVGIRGGGVNPANAVGDVMVVQALLELTKWAEIFSWGPARREAQTEYESGDLRLSGPCAKNEQILLGRQRWPHWPSKAGSEVVIKAGVDDHRVEHLACPFNRGSAAV